MSSRSQIDSVQTLFKNEKNTPQSTEKRGHMAIVAIHQQSQCRNTVGGAFSGLPQLTYQSRDWAFWERGGGGLKRQALKRSIHTEGDE